MELAHWEVARFLDIQGEPIMRRIKRQSHAMPQYHVGHCEKIARVNQRLKQFPTLALAGSSLNGVGVPGCIESGETAAGKLASALTPASTVSARVICH